MPEAALVALLIAFPALGAAIRRWPALALPLAGWPPFYLGLDRGWWGHGRGDGWEYAAAFFTAAGLASTAVAVAVSRSLRRGP